MWPHIVCEISHAPRSLGRGGSRVVRPSLCTSLCAHERQQGLSQTRTNTRKLVLCCAYNVTRGHSFCDRQTRTHAHNGGHAREPRLRIIRIYACTIFHTHTHTHSIVIICVTFAFIWSSCLCLTVFVRASACCVSVCVCACD